ncbi:MAG: hypothetical protein KJ964_09990 [Verrucomicrobia bacterium]|nr:hypothetical protein [Verrucomicrobiota bacterium]MBU1734638.1 hypothetical protein [Verrucomicrobiota bacterium]MBU1858035.1 hypothetical protein [Verrucomicrobiota bacterium]
MNLSLLRNPVWQRADNLRDPAVLPLNDGYRVFYSRYSNQDWGKEENWAVASVFTQDFLTFKKDRDISPKGFASPGDPILWYGRHVIPYQQYLGSPARLCYSESENAEVWSEPKFFLLEAHDLPWNTHKRVIDPTFVVEGERLHCFFVGSCDTETGGRHANLLGHAVTTDANLRVWDIVTYEQPLIGRSERSYDGVENVTVFRTGDCWTMIYSEGLAEQHLAYAQSSNLMNWVIRGSIKIPSQGWMKRKHGAPFVWKEGNAWLMILMGTDINNHTTLGLLTSENGVAWSPLPERE